MSQDWQIVPPERSARSVWDATVADGATAHLVGTPDQLLGVVTRERLAAAVDAGGGHEPIGGLADGAHVHGHPDQPSDVVLERLAQSGGVLPIMSREQSQRVLGVVTFPHVMRYLRARRDAQAEAP